MFRVFVELQRQLGECLQPLLETSGKRRLHPYGFRNYISNSLTTADASLPLLGADIAEWMRGTASPIAFARLVFAAVSEHEYPSMFVYVGNAQQKGLSQSF